MRFRTSKNSNGDLHYEFSEEITIGDFYLLMERIASLFQVQPEHISIPEAEIGKLTLDAAQIYAKYDLVYGLEIDSTGLTTQQQTELEAVLAKN